MARKYFTLLDGSKVREFTGVDGNVNYEFVSEIPEDRVLVLRKGACYCCSSLLDKLADQSSEAEKGKIK
ncbi:hypothetical protein [Oceanobacillus senegalensis]|uniref:hypothetical protein n=1 Tax=Oceanobacillus senegalensis TaxID=1936063 RepID=UPI000A3108F2|nr:hypothetical protein [Oceanobacillus senegalensis]